ncbi:MAG: hypothetical protein ACPL4N_00050 [Candidatus Norongarragalinales archaeon]
MKQVFDELASSNAAYKFEARQDRVIISVDGLADSLCRDRVRERRARVLASAP